MKVKPHLILREKGLNFDFKLKGSDFDGSLLDLLNEFYYVKVLGFQKGKIAKCVKEDKNDEILGIEPANRWKIGDEIVIEKVVFAPYGIFLENKQGQNLCITRAEILI